MRLGWLLRAQRIVYSAIQPTGTLHLGNYFGAVQSWCRIQSEPNTQLYISIADLHAITTGLPQPGLLRDNIRQMAACLLACGLDPERTVFFQQSRVALHTQLAWVLAATVTTSQLQRLSQFADKAQAYARDGNIPIGLMTYPILQAADILMYRATHVPVGEDQTQHLEITCRIARKFNLAIGEDYLVEPKALYTQYARVRSLRDASKKMSKSDPDGRSRIEIDDDDRTIGKKCRKALTDSTGGTMEFDPSNRPALSNLIQLHSAVLDCSPADIVDQHFQLNKVAYKDKLATDIINLIGPIRERYRALMADAGALDRALEAGAVRANAEAGNNMQHVMQKCGFTL